MATSFLPRTTFPTITSLPRSYFLGHHKVGLHKMKTLLSQIDLVVECRDYRVPITSRNPLLEESLAGRPRIIVYTKRDLGFDEGHTVRSTCEASKLVKSFPHHERKRSEDIVRAWHGPTAVHFSSSEDPATAKRLLHVIKQIAADPARSSLFGLRVLVAGMPNVGKSTLLNNLRRAGMPGKGKVARTGANPGVTRKVGGLVKIVDGAELDRFAGVQAEQSRSTAVRPVASEGIYIQDTPGVFMPYVPDQEAMLKLALCGSVKDTIIPPVTLADYLLYQLNLRLEAKRHYTAYTLDDAPTNDVMVVLEGIARQVGRLLKGGVPDVEAAALWMVQRWRQGLLGRFVLDAVDETALERQRRVEQDAAPSLSQARKAEREARRERSRGKVMAGRI